MTTRVVDYDKIADLMHSLRELDGSWQAKRIEDMRTALAEAEREFRRTREEGEAKILKLAGWYEHAPHGWYHEELLGFQADVAGVSKAYALSYCKAIVAVATKDYVEPAAKVNGAAAEAVTS